VASKAVGEVWMGSGRYLWLSKQLLLGVWLRPIPPAGHHKGGGTKQPRPPGGDDKN
jgi:hypothetical protein